MARIGRSDSAIGDDKTLERWGCGIFILAVLLFASQRLVLFTTLDMVDTRPTSATTQTHRFLFGDPPYSILDILLGFEIPDEGLLFLLQPHNILLGFTQAVHTGVNFGLAYCLFWIVQKVLDATRTRPWLRMGGCVSAIVVVSAVVVGGVSLLDSAVSPETAESQRYLRFDNPEFGLEFEYPEYLEVSYDEASQQGPGGEFVSLISISATSTDPMLGVVFKIIEDPLRDLMFPSLYPVPPDNAFRTLVASEITLLEYPRNSSNSAALESASDRAEITEVSGFPAATYTVSLEGTPIGHAYVRGALVITARRDVSLYVMGSDEPNAPGSVGRSDVDALWERVISGLIIDY